MLIDVWPKRAQFRPDETVRLAVSVSGARPGALTVIGRVFTGGERAGQFECPLTVVEDGGGQGEVILDGLGSIPPPGASVGYAVEVTVKGTEARATSAFDIAPHWSAAPRYGFACDFSPEEQAEESERRADDLLRLHVNVVQFYDWMASHHTFLAPQAEFTDPLGRHLSHAVVRRKVDLAHDRGMAALGYGALYGAEEDFSREHPDWLLYDGAKRPLALAGTFYLQDFARGSGWREWILAQYRRALVEVGFDGIHIDQYGFPKQALARSSGSWREVDLGAEFPGFVEEAASALQELRPEGGSLFNCVNAWPLEAMAGVTADAATYIEVWDPHSTYRDLYELVRRARTLRPDRQVILAAYLRPFHPTDGRGRGALNTFRLASATINASGGFHLIAGEGRGVLSEAYYPNYGHLEEGDYREVRRHFDFIVRNTALLHATPVPDIAWTHVGPTNEAILLSHPDLVRYGAGAQSDSLWVVGRETGQVVSLQLVNLRGLRSEEWNLDHPEAPRPLENVEVRARVAGCVDGVWWDTPDDAVGLARPLPFEIVQGEGGPFLVFRVPRVAYWSTVWWRRAESPR
ncbi:MAG: hypothetical protein A2V75_01505 [Actinobacteria bacterium RBG_16_70_17]|nr:MAG: hypothetical protein A2V75_01505 [Actinobacteria bacterium RBG_16_70_17]